MRECCAIVVTYNPDVHILENAIAATCSQVEKIYVIDNGSTTPFDAALAAFEQVQSVFLKENIGIAAGFNIGIQMARKAGFRYVLLLDQDSIPPQGMVSRCRGVIEQLSAGGTHVAAVGPRYYNQKTGHRSRFVRFNWFHNAYHCGTDDSPIVPADFLISSGSLYDLTVFDHVGLFNEGLFIDHVDTEWFLRAQSLGYRSFGVWDLNMEHSLGESWVRLWFLRWRIQPMHKPFRLYYIVRNSLLIYRMAHAPGKWVSCDMVRILRLILVYLFFSPLRFEALCWILCGARDGLCGVFGPSPSKSD